jgi:hypothetical protein
MCIIDLTLAVRQMDGCVNLQCRVSVNGCSVSDTVALFWVTTQVLVSFDLS